MNRSEQRYRRRRYYAANRERVRAYNRAYYASHPEDRARRIAAVQRRRAAARENA